MKKKEDPNAREPEEIRKEIRAVADEANRQYHTDILATLIGDTLLSEVPAHELEPLLDKPYAEINRHAAIRRAADNAEIFSIGLVAYTRNQCIKALAALDDLDEKKLSEWTDAQLSGRLGELFNADYDGEVAVNDALRDTVKEDFDAEEGDST